MSDNLRMAIIVVVFVILGAILWGFATRTSDEPLVEPIASAPEIQPRVTSVPEFDFDDAPETRPKAAVRRTAPLQDENLSQADASDSETENDSISEKARGKGKITGEITMTDGGVIPSDLNVVLHYVPDDARYDASVDTVHAATKVNEAGTYSFDDLPLGRFVLFGVSETYTGTINRTLTAQRPEYAANLSLYPSASISGRVINTKGEAVTNAHVFVAGYLSGGSDLKADLYRSRASGVAVDEQGTFRMTSLQVREPALQYRLLAAAPGYAPTITELYPTGAADVDILLDSGGSVAGTVIDLGSDEAMPNVSLRAVSDYAMAASETTTDEQGTFAFNGLSSGTHHFDVLEPNLVVSSESLSIEVAPEQLIDDLVINVQIGGMVAGRVYDEDTQVGVGGVTINARPENIPVAQPKDVKTDSSGYYLVQGLHAGNYRIEYSDMEGYPRDNRWEDRQEVVASLGQRLSGVDFPVSKGLSISGTVVDTRGDPIKQVWVNASVQNSNLRDSRETRESGAFAVYGFAPKTTVNVNVSGRGFGRQYRAVTIDNDSVTGIRFVLGPEGKISGVVVDSSGNPVSNVDIYARSDDSNNWGGSDSPNARGEFELDGLGEGNYYLKPSYNDMFSSSDPTLAEVHLSAGEHAEGLRLVLKGHTDGLEIAGRITDDRGEPVVGAQLNSWGHGGGNARGSSDAEGRYELRNLQPGTYNINAAAAKYTPQQLSVEAGAMNADIVMPRTGSISGEVINARSGEPITDFQLLLVNGRYRSDMDRDFKRYHHEEGEFSLDGAQPTNSVSLIARASGFAETVVEVHGVQSGELLPNVRIAMASGNELRGVVVDGAGNRLSGASVFKGPVPRNQYERERNAKTRTDGNGEFTLEGLPRGEVVVSAYLKGLSPDEVAVDIGTGRNDVQLTLTEGGSVEGIVTLDGEPVPNANIYGNVFGGGQGQSSYNIQSNTNNEGYFVAGGLPDGQGNVSANLNIGGQNRNMSIQMQVSEGMTTEVNFPFETASSSIEGHIMVGENETGSGRVSLSVNTESGATESRYMEVAVDGHYQFQGLPSGAVTMRVFGGQMSRQKTVNATLGKNEDMRLDLIMYGGSTLRCFISNAPEHTVVFAALLAPGTPVPAQFDMSFFQNMAGSLIQQAQVQNGVGVMDGIENGSYTVLAVAYTMLEDGVDFSTMRAVTSEVVIEDQPEVEVELSF